MPEEPKIFAFVGCLNTPDIFQMLGDALQGAMEAHLLSHLHGGEAQPQKATPNIIVRIVIPCAMEENLRETVESAIAGDLSPLLPEGVGLDIEIIEDGNEDPSFPPLVAREVRES